MEDGPEAAEGNYPYRDKIYRLVEEESWVWQVLDADIYLGQVVAKDGGRDGQLYSIDFVGQEGEVDEPWTDDWRRALEYLIDHAVIDERGEAHPPTEPAADD